MKQRAMRIAEAIKEEVGNLLLYELKDPRIAFVSVTEVEVSGDLRLATIYFSVLGSEEEKKATLKGLSSSKGVLRRAIGQRLQLRHTPEIEIALDDSIARGAKILEILAKELPPENGSALE
ncbi:MAG: 30S ribosome-binding factor RbfA [Symbiobacteriaceae bacterium]|nr:30S ribosome-binding factor RbfA [Symbiobacteriaceae bacterium]